MNNNEKKIIFIAGGGTGGHIYPGVAIAKALHEIRPDIQIQFVGTPSGLEKNIIPKEGYPLILIPVGKLNHEGGFSGKIKTLFQIPIAMWKSYQILRKHPPLYVLGVGGYASGPFVLVASLMGLPTGIWEPNAIPGLTNRWLSHFIGEAFVVFPEARKQLHTRIMHRVGLPVRKAIEKVARKGSTNRDHQKDPLFHVLIFGGSQGARAINQTIREMLLQAGEWLNDFKIIHQTGKADFEDLRKAYQKLSGNVQCEEYLFRMEEYYQWADLIICRSGASTVAEIAACGKPAIFIPLPTAADDHQTKNAMSVVAQEAGVLLKQSELSPMKLIEKITELKDNSLLREQMRDNLLKFYQPKAAESIAQLILNPSKR